MKTIQQTRWIRDWIRDDPCRYRMYGQIFLNKRIRLATLGTDLVLEGYPRSGNTYARYLLEHLTPNLHFTSHTHTIAALKAAIKFDTFCLILIREPEAAIASMCCKYKVTPDESAIGHYLKDYLHYHNFVLSQKHNFCIFRFDHLVSRPDHFIRVVAERTGVTMELSGIQENVTKVEAVMEAKEPLKEPTGSSLPNARKTYEKLVYIPLIQEHVLLPSAKQLYNELHCLSVAFSDSSSI